MGAHKDPHGGILKELYLDDRAAAEEKVRARDYVSWSLTPRQLCDAELILDGSFSPLEGFLNRRDYEPVLSEMRLASGLLWPIPVTLDVTEEFAEGLSVGDSLALRDHEGVVVATMRIDDLWRPDHLAESWKVFGSDNVAHPGVDVLLHHTQPVYVGGVLTGVERPQHYDFRLLRDTPAELRARFHKLGWRRVVGFQTRNPMHRAHREFTLRAAMDHEASLLLHPVVGMTKPGDIDHYTRVRCYERILKKYPEQTTTLSLLNLAMRMAGPREALLHGIVRKNFGCTHFIVGRDHAGPGVGPDGQPFYEPEAARKLYRQHEKELDICMIEIPHIVYVEDKAQYLPADQTTPDMKTHFISSSEFRRRLAEGLEIPPWYSYPDIIKELRRIYPPRSKQGFTVFFTGLSGSGKSTIANALLVKLLEIGKRHVTLLDGDLVRKHLSSELGFSREHRNLNMLRIGFVASEITKNGGVAICAPIAPYKALRRAVRRMIEPVGGFIQVYVATPLEVCEQRDRKGLYAKARAGKIKGFTGIDDPYDVPEEPEVCIDTASLSPELAAHRILVKLESLGYIK